MSADQHPASQARSKPPRILIIENEVLIAEMIHQMVHDLGYVVTRTVHRFPSAVRELSKENFDGALVNIGIDQQKHGIEIADILLEMGIPFGFVTGYAQPLSKRHANVPLLQKPFTEDQLRGFLEKLVGPSGVLPGAHTP
jgi:CheY-like chemotaxis protein